MINGGKMVGSMMTMIHEKGMMSNKGMDMKRMNKMDSSEKDDHKHH